MSDSNPVTVTGLRYSKHFVHSKIKYRVLMANQLSHLDIDHVRARLKPIVTGPAAAQFVFEMASAAVKENKNSLWSYTDGSGIAGIVKYKGIEVMLYYKRQITEVSPGPGEPLPESPLVDPDDVWQRLDLLGPSAKRANIILTLKHEQLEEENRLLREQVALQTAQIAGFEHVLNKVQVRTDIKTQIQQNKEDRERQKARAKKRIPQKRKQDRLCTHCKCYENWHRFDKKGRCLGCDGPHAKCHKCLFKPKRAKKVIVK